MRHGDSCRKTDEQLPERIKEREEEREEERRRERQRKMVEGENKRDGGRRESKEEVLCLV